MNRSEAETVREEVDAEPVVLHLGRFAHGAPQSAGAGFSDGTETALIRKAAAEAVATHLKPVVVPKAAAPLSPDEMLGAVAYCYVKGVFSSADIERKMLRDPEFRAALDGTVPDPETIRRFRRLNREAIQTVLEKFYASLRSPAAGVSERLTWSRHDAGTVQAPALRTSLATGVGGGPTRAPGENTATFVKREAIEQLELATFVDRMSDF